VDEPACVVVRGTIEQKPIAHGTEATVPSSAPLSLASYEEVMSGRPQIPEPFSLAPTNALLTRKAMKIYCGSVVTAMSCLSGVYLAKTIQRHQVGSVLRQE
jgi:hypothetical protein